jgi:hypothetical protein
MSPNALTGHVAHAVTADRLRAAEHGRLVAEARPARRSLLAMLSRLRPFARPAITVVPAPSEG